VKRLREERDRLRAEVERLRPKEAVGWRFFAPAFEQQGCWAVRGEKGFAFLVSNKTVGEAEWCVADRQEITAHEAYNRLADWPEGQRKFRELTGYEPVVKECLTTEPEDRVRCYRNGSGRFFWAAIDGEPAMYFDADSDFLNTSSYSESTIKGRFDMARIPFAEALDIVADRPKQLAKLLEMAGVEEPKDSVRCYRSKYGSSVLVYGVQHNTHFSPHGDWGPAQSESATIKNKIRCTIAEARDMLADKPTSLAEFDRITGHEDRERLARLMSIPCKEMRT
jgi:hypothetical protein